MNYTKGEWKNIKMTNGTNRILVDGGTQSTSDDEQICEYITNEANAQLIASAPDEDDCLRRFGEYVAVNYDDNNKPFYYIDQEWFDMRTKALAKVDNPSAL